MDLQRRPETQLRCEVIGNATLYLGDCLQVLPQIGRADHVITDPPYEAEAHTKQRRVLGRGVSQTRAVMGQPLPFPPLTDELRDGFATWASGNCDGWAIAFCQTEAVGMWRDAFDRAGAKWRRAGIWVKPDGSPQLTGDRPAPGHEAIAMAWCGQGRSRWNGGGTAAVYVHGKHDDGMGHGGAPKFHPTQKPRVLIERLVGLFTQPRDLVCDPFMGAGTTGVACIRTGRSFVGVETVPEYFDIACERISAAYAQGRLFA